MLKINKRNISKKSLIYTGGTVIASISMTLSTYLYSKYTTPGNFGDFQLTLSIMMLLVTVGFLDIKTSTLRFMYGVEQETEENRNKAIYGGGLVMFISSLLLFLLLYITTKITFVPFPKEGLIWGLLYAIGSYYLFVTRGLDRELDYSIGYSIYFVVLVSMNLIFLSLKNYNAEYILIAMALGELAQTIYLEIKIGVMKNFKLKYLDKKIIRHMIKFSIPLAITALGTWIMTYYASIQITKILGSAANGIYSMSMDFARAIPTATSGIILAWQEIAFSQERKLTGEENKALFTKSITNFFLIYCCIFITFIPLMKLIIPYYLSKSFQEVSIILALTCAAYVLDCIGQMIASIFGNDIDSTPIMISTISGSIFLIVSLPILLNYFDLFGAAIACFSAFAITLIIRLLWLRFKKHYRINLLKLALYISISIAFGYLSSISDYKINIVLLVLALAISLPTLLKLKKQI